MHPFELSVQLFGIRMGGQVSTIKAAAGKFGPENKRKGSRGEKAKIGILAFEVSNLMSKTLLLWQSLSDQEIIRLRTEVIKMEGVLRLVSSGEAVLLSLACKEKLQDLISLANSVARLGKRCQESTLQGFEHVFHDILRNNIDVRTLAYPVKGMEITTKKMERYIASTSNLYQELEILADLEQAVRRIRDDEDGANRDSLAALELKLSWQRQEIKYLRDLSLWNRTFDKVVMLLARAVCTVYSRILGVFGAPIVGAHEVPLLPQTGEYNHLFQARFASPQLSPGLISRIESTLAEPGNGACMSSQSSSSPSSGTETSLTSPVSSETHLPPELEATSGQCAPCVKNSPAQFGAATILHSDDMVDEKFQKTSNESMDFQNGCAVSCLYPIKMQSAHQTQSKSYYHDALLNKLFFDPKLIHQGAPASTLGGAALSLHYANVIIILEKMIRFPQLVGSDARDDLYRMLPKNVRVALRSRLRCPKTYELTTPSSWRDELDPILSWLTPLAHNTLRWQSEHNFEQQLVPRTNVLLLQTLYFADQTKAEEYITEILVGLNYLCWHERELKCNAAMDYVNAREYEGYVDWQF